MYKKEIIDTLKVFFQTLLLLLIIPFALLLDWHILHSQWEMSGIYQFVFQVIIVFFAAYSGVSIFQREKTDRALEYLFTLPMSRYSILMAKILPRLGMLILLIAFGLFCGVLTHFLADIVSILLVFFLAISISLAVESLVNAMLGVVLLNAVVYYFSLILSYLTLHNRLLDKLTPSIWITSVLPVVLMLGVMAIAFLKVLKRFDLKPLKWQAKPYLMIALPTILLIILVILIYLKKYLAWVVAIG